MSQNEIVYDGMERLTYVACISLIIYILAIVFAFVVFSLLGLTISSGLGMTVLLTVSFATYEVSKTTVYVHNGRILSPRI